MRTPFLLPGQEISLTRIRNSYNRYRKSESEIARGMFDIAGKKCETIVNSKFPTNK